MNLDERIAQIGAMMKEAGVSLLGDSAHLLSQPAKRLQNGETMNKWKPINVGDPLLKAKKRPLFPSNMQQDSPYNTR